MARFFFLFASKTAGLPSGAEGEAGFVTRLPRACRHVVALSMSAVEYALSRRWTRSPTHPHGGIQEIDIVRFCGQDRATLCRRWVLQHLQDGYGHRDETKSWFSRDVVPRTREGITLTMAPQTHCATSPYTPPQDSSYDEPVLSAVRGSGGFGSSSHWVNFTALLQAQGAGTAILDAKRFRLDDVGSSSLPFPFLTILPPRQSGRPMGGSEFCTRVLFREDARNAVAVVNYISSDRKQAGGGQLLIRDLLPEGVSSFSKTLAA